jgi:signal peptidase
VSHSKIGVGRINMKPKKKNFVEKSINLLLNALIFIFAIILLISIYTGVQTKVLGNDYTDFFGYSLFEVQTGSMADTIDAGDWIIVKLTRDVKLNDVVTYKLDGEYVTHRVIEVYNGTYVTKGDANNAKDEPIDQSQVVGKVVKTLANFGIIRKTLFNPSVLIALIVTLFLFDYAFKKNKNESKISKFNNKKSNVVFTDFIIKKIISYSNIVFKKLILLFEKIKKFINDKKLKKIAKDNKYLVKNNNVSKIESKNLESNEQTYNFDKFKETAPKIEKVEKDEYYTESDELNKTSFFRVIPVDANEVDDRFKELPTKSEIEEYYTDADELDKTSFFRMIPVDASEVNDTLLEIAQNEIKEADKNDKNKEKITKPVQEKKIEELADDTLTNINLDLLKENIKGKNVIDTVMLIKKEELKELVNTLVDDEKIRVNKVTIKEAFIDTYIDAKYYNYFGEKNVEYSGKNLISKIEKAIKEVALASLLMHDYHGNDTKYSDIVDMYADTFILLANLEQAEETITDSKAKKEFYKKEIKKYSKDWVDEKVEHLIDEIMIIQKKYDATLEYFFKKLETNMFNLNFNKLVTKKDMYGLALEHNITFSKVYSDYIIDKTYTEGIVAEDKMTVLLTLLSVQLIKDMFLSNFNKKYILYMTESLYSKEKKFEKLLRMIDDKYAKDNVIILITFEILLNNKKIIKKVRKMGYKFALVFNQETSVLEKNRGDIYIADYIFINKKVVNIENILSLIPEELLDKVIYEDIVEKVGDFGGEDA